MFKKYPAVNYPLVILWKMAIEIVDLPSCKMVALAIVFCKQLPGQVTYRCGKPVRNVDHLGFFHMFWYVYPTGCCPTVMFVGL